jgi:very-short-patch-repair endonuclease
VNVARVKPHESTEYENLFFYKLCRRLKGAGFRGEIHKNVLIFWKGRRKYPDIYIPSWALVIEIDGPVHDQNEFKLRIDHYRDGFYDDLRIRVMRIPNYWIGNEAKVNRVITEILSYFLNNLPSLETQAITAEKLENGRFHFARNFPNEAKAHSEVQAVRIYRDDLAEAFQGYRFFRGVRVVIK